LSTEGQMSRSERKCKTCFFLAYLRYTWVDLRQTKTNSTHWRRSILHISSNTFHQRKYFVFVIFVCSCPGGSNDSGHLAVHLLACACDCVHVRCRVYGLAVECRVFGGGGGGRKKRVYIRKKKKT